MALTDLGIIPGSGLGAPAGDQWRICFRWDDPDAFDVEIVDYHRIVKTMAPVHPGETLWEDFVKPLGLSASRLAVELMVPVTRVTGIFRGKRAVTADTSLRLAGFFGTTPQFWMNLQANYDLELAEDARGAEIAERIRPHSAA